MHLAVAGGTGAVGSALIELAAAAGHRVTAVGRRPAAGADAQIATDFRDDLQIPSADAAVCCLGTTMARAGSRAAFYAVDHEAVLAFAQAALAAGTRHFLVVTAINANPRAAVFYSRVKGEVERDLQALGFPRLDIVRPGLLLGTRAEHRPVERLLQRLDPLTRRAMPGPLARYAGIPARTVAAALLTLCGEQAPGVYRHDNLGMRERVR
jgi:uncharacterized protein YbjT (DUF2867 family)